MSEEFQQGRLFPKEAAEAIDIATATLRKYSQTIEEVIGNDQLFQRTDQNVRTYSQKNIELLKRISKESTETKKSVKSIVEVLWAEEPELFEDNVITQEVATQENNDSPTIQELLAIIDQQNKKIDQLLQAMTTFTTEVRQEFNEVKPMIEKSQQLIETSGEQTEKMQEDIQLIRKETEELKEEHKALGDSPFENKATMENQSETKQETTETKSEEKVGFFQRLFGKK